METRKDVHRCGACGQLGHNQGTCRGTNEPRSPSPCETLQHGLGTRPARCPKCESRVLTQEPAFTSCFDCGGLFPIRGADLSAQYEYEHLVPKWDRRRTTDYSDLPIKKPRDK